MAYEAKQNFISSPYPKAPTPIVRNYYVDVLSSKSTKTAKKGNLVISQKDVAGTTVCSLGKS